MAKRRMVVVECDLCRGQQVEQVAGDLEVLGLTIREGFYAGESGGGPLPRGLFICNECVQGNDEHGPALLQVLVALVWKEPGQGWDEFDAVYAPKQEVGSSG